MHGTFGGPGKEFWANGKNWEPDTAFLASAERGAKRTGRGPYFGAWRLEVSPGAPRDADRFLHVLMAADTSAKPPQVRKVVTDTCDGVMLAVPQAGGGTAEVTILFNRAGDVGGLFTAGQTVAPRPLATTIQPQRGLATLK